MTAINMQKRETEVSELYVKELLSPCTEHMKVGGEGRRREAVKRETTCTKRASAGRVAKSHISLTILIKKIIFFLFSLKQEGLYSDPPRVYVKEM